MKRFLILSILVQSLALVACGDDIDPVDQEPDASTDGDNGKDNTKDPDPKDPDPNDPEGDCDGTAPAIMTIQPRDDGKAVNEALCAIDGGVKHIRVEGVKAPPFHTSYQLYLGLDEPIGAQDDLPEGALRLMAYGGGTPMPPASFTIGFGEHSVGLPGDASFVNDGTTFCLDVFNGDADTSPAIVFWVEGHEGADCDDPATLTHESAFASVVSIGEAKGAIALEKDSYFYLKEGLVSEPTITLNNENVVSRPAAPSACGTDVPLTQQIELAEDGLTNYALCPVEGGARHLIVDGLVVPSGGHASAQLYIGLDEAIGPQATLPEGAIRVMAYGGTFFQITFGGESVSIPNPSFLEDGTPFCLDIHDGSETSSPSVYLWLDGHGGADCSDRDTLTMYNTYGAIHQFEGVTGRVAFEKDTFFYAAANVTAAPTITLDNQNVIEDALVTSCVEAGGTETIELVPGENITNHYFCPISPSIGHIRVEEADFSVAHSTIQLYLGVDEVPASHSDAPPAGALRIMIYAGAAPYMGPTIGFYFGEGSASVADADFLAEGTPFCIDIHNGSATLSPAFVLWVNGHEGADCGNQETLAVDNAYAILTDIADEDGNTITGTIASNQKSFHYSNKYLATGNEFVTITREVAPITAADDVRP